MASAFLVMLEAEEDDKQQRLKKLECSEAGIFALQLCSLLTCIYIVYQCRSWKHTSTPPQHLALLVATLPCQKVRAVSHIHRIRTETESKPLQPPTCSRPLTYEPNPWTKCKRMPVQFGLSFLSDSRNTFTILSGQCHCLMSVAFIVVQGLVPQSMLSVVLWL